MKVQEEIASIKKGELSDIELLARSNPDTQTHLLLNKIDELRLSQQNLITNIPSVEILNLSNEKDLTGHWHIFKCRNRRGNVQR